MPSIKQDAMESDARESLKCVSEIENIVLQMDVRGISYDGLRNQTGKTMREIRQIASSLPHVVEIKRMLYHEDTFIDWEDGVIQLDAIIEKLMKKNNGYISAAQLYAYAHAEMYIFLNDNDMDDERAVYELAQHLYEKNAYNGKHYIFTEKSHISMNTDVTSNFGIFCKYAEDHDGVFRFSDLEEYLSSMGIRLGNLRGQMKVYTEPFFLNYDEDIFIYAKYIGINDEWKEKVKTALNKLFSDVGDHIVLRDIQPLWFRQLPELPKGLYWTSIFLQNVLRYYSQELGARTIIAMDSQKIETLHTMLVKNDSPIQNFGDAVVSFLLENEETKRNFTAEELRQLLVKGNLIQGGELIGNMAKALGRDERFAWDADGGNVAIRI